MLAILGTALAGLAVTAAPTVAAGGQLGDVTGYERSGDTYTFRSGAAALRVIFSDDDLFRVWLAPDGKFSDPANADPNNPHDPDADIIVKGDYPGGRSTVAETDTAYVIKTAKAQLTVTKKPLTLHLATAGGKALWDETAPLSWNADGTAQSLSRADQEQFFGGGMQNGRFSHRDQTIQISRDFNWNDGGNPNAAPFYVSSRGYGVLRNTFAPGSYAFTAPVRTNHDEQRFDAYYFVGDAEQVIDGYTELTGRPMAVPMYALEIGDADCYLHNANRGERETLRDSKAIADGYAEHGMPLGWMLVNDGYGCGYEDLAETGDMLQGNGSELGLWTESDLTNQETEVAAGVRVRKTDVAWVGPGYRFALDACEKSRDGIEDNSEDRATVLTVEGWAGTQRCAAPWSGDQSGTFEYIRWQIPTYAGSTMSGQHLATGDVDGIFGGSAKTYARDLQWKMFLPMTYAMSGWANSDKQPWRYGAPYTAINRKYLMLHERLLPYFYTHTMRAHQNGVGATKPLYLNYPSDPNTWGDKVKYEFLAGDDFLVAPVYEDSTRRDGIYLPKGTWVDYWSGRVHQGPKTIDGYKAPLDTLPLFVRAGAVVPQFPEGTLDWKQGKDSGRLDLDVYPQGTSSFVNYEDDGRTQAHATGKNASQEFKVDAPRSGAGDVEIKIGAVKGSYAGKPGSRGYTLSVHTDRSPDRVTVGGSRLTKRTSKAALDGSRSGWFHDADAGITWVRTDALSTSREVEVELEDSAAVGGIRSTARDVALDSTVNPIAVAGEATELSTTFTNQTGVRVSLQGITPTVPTGWTATPTGAAPTGRVEPGKSVTATYQLTPAAAAEPGTAELSLRASYTVDGQPFSVTDRSQTTLAFADVASAANNVGVTRSDNPAPGNLDGGGNSFLAERLAEKGVTPGAQLSLNGFDFTWPNAQPGTEDNVAADSATVSVTGQGNALAFLGTGTSGSAAGTATVHYADGTTSTATLGFPNWCCLATDSYGAKIAVAMKGRNTQAGPANATTDYRLYTKTLRIDPSKQVVAVTLPSAPSVHVFAMTVGTEDVVPPPVPNGQYSLTNTESGLALDAPGNTSAGQLTVSPVGAAASQKWVLTQQDDGSYQIKNAGSGLCADVAFSSQTSGAEVVQYSCGTTPNQRWAITNAAGVLTIKAKHSGLSLAAGAGGLVVQVTDTGAANQRWRATAN
ncbi:RICIN domain-containing protein [Nocardioides speluncae]|uniref:RICIN domain-containing protein n=1 Tax=Nocardioides speluncae TaxID=2670337 RepID=UPI001F0C2A76|nr:RICIN domain-containing protein [Nocardioides speluncae]